MRRESVLRLLLFLSLRNNSMAVLLKVYGHIYPASELLEKDLSLALQSAIQDTISLDIPLLQRDKDMLRISFEGMYFPEDEIIKVFERHLERCHHGKLDILDMSEWHMTRYFFEGGELQKRSASLNHVLDYSGF